MALSFSSSPRRRPAVSEAERLRRENERLQRQLAEQRQRLADQQQQFAEQQQRIRELEQEREALQREIAELRKDSRTSHRPPASDPPAARACRPRARSRGRPGAKPGHSGHGRRLAPAAQVTEVRTVLPTQCRHCQAPFPSDPAQVRTRGSARRRQVTEIPPLVPTVTEWRAPHLLCDACGQSTQATLPASVTASAFGPRLTALIASLTVAQRVSRRGLEEVLADVLGCRIALGTVQARVEEASAALAAPVEALQEQIAQAPILHVDETGWATQGQRRWLWVFVTPLVVLYRVAATRAAQVLTGILGTAFAGVLTSDRWGAYEKYHRGPAQLCWAHLKRDLAALAETGSSATAILFGRDGLAIVASLFRLWHKFQAGAIPRTALRSRMGRVRRRLDRLLVVHRHSTDHGVRVLAAALEKHFAKLFTFVEQEGVEPTNNRAERALRPAVQWRKLSFGTQSVAGEQAVARLLTARQTCRGQGRNGFAYLTEAIRCHREGQPVPTLLPDPPTH
jgi:transposase